MQTPTDCSRVKPWLFPLLLISSIAATACSEAPKPLPQPDAAYLQQQQDNYVLVKGGEFMMGAFEMVVDGQRGYNAPASAFPAHQVQLDDYYIQKYEVTWAEYDVFADATGVEKYRINRTYRPPNYPAGAKTWLEAQDYCKWLGDKLGMQGSLPTEAQWEYAARSRGQYYHFATNNGWYQNFANLEHKDKPMEPHAPGKYPPNPLGLYDMSGNVNEWVFDWFDAKYYAQSQTDNPLGPKNGEEKIQRGGGIGLWIYNYATYSRAKLPPNNAGGFLLGWRCAMNPQPLPLDQITPAIPGPSTTELMIQRSRDRDRTP